MSYSVQKMCHALFIPFLGRSASRLFCLSEEQITQKSWVDPSSPESRMPLRYSHDRDQICHSLLKENLSRSPRQASRCCLWGRKLWGGYDGVQMSCVPNADALPVPGAEGRPVLTCFEAHTMLNWNVGMQRAYMHPSLDWLTRKAHLLGRHTVYLSLI